jgi:ABC-type nitrate/sulfonate/bicarbonate transport system ATPase subunit
LIIVEKSIRQMGLAGDEQTWRKFHEDLCQLGTDKKEKIFVFVIHSIEEAVFLSDRITI